MRGHSREAWALHRKALFRLNAGRFSVRPPLLGEKKGDGSIDPAEAMRG